MKRQQAKELLPIIKAFAEGKTIQYYTNLTPHWIDIDPDRAVNFSDASSQNQNIVHLKIKMSVGKKCKNINLLDG